MTFKRALAVQIQLSLALMRIVGYLFAMGGSYAFVTSVADIYKTGGIRRLVAGSGEIDALTFAPMALTAGVALLGLGSIKFANAVVPSPDEGYRREAALVAWTSRWFGIVLFVVGVWIEVEVLRHVDVSAAGLEGSQLKTSAWTTFHLAVGVMILTGLVMSGIPQAVATWALKE